MKRLSRSENMARIRSRDTRPELILRKAMWAAGYRYRLKTDLPGRPDLAFTRQKVAVFVDGCFWHGCPHHYSTPESRFDFWADKLQDNITRDKRVDAALKGQDWTVIHIWQHDLRRLDNVVQQIGEVLHTSGRQKPVLW